jgi:ABC-2 type transport system ATP-binding protein
VQIRVSLFPCLPPPLQIYQILRYHLQALPLLTCHNLNKRFHTVHAVIDLDLSLEGGVIFGFLGPNGAGKTTAIKMMAGILQPTSGSVNVCGIDMALDPSGAKRFIGYMPQDVFIYDKLTAREFLRFACELYGGDFRKEHNRALELLDAFELSEKANALCGSLSGGQKQKLMLASLLMHRPKVLLLDEPTNGLDPKSARLVKDLLRKLAAQGIAVLMSTHIMEVAERMCDRIGIIHQGRLVAQGTLTDLRVRAARGDGAGGEATLEDIFLELTGGDNITELIAFLE